MKLTLLLAVGALAAFALRKRSAASRHFVWALALGASLALPLFSMIAPKLALPIAGVERLPALATIGIGIVESPAAIEAADVDADVDADAIAVAASTASPSRWSIGAVLLAVWLAGALFLLARQALAHLGLLKLTRDATPFAARGRARIGISDAAGAPLTWGWFAPVILLPKEARTWPTDQLDAAIEHEQAHIARADWLTQLVAHLACAAYWFHPLVWIAAKRLRVESEHASDDRVLSGGRSAPDYASHLVAVARGARPLRFQASALSIASHLEERVLAVLDDARPRGSLSRGVRIAAIFCAVAGALAVGGVSTSAQAESKSSDHLVRELPVSSGGVLELELITGADVDIRGWDELSVRVDAALGGRDHENSVVRIDGGGERVVVRIDQRAGSGSYSTSHKLQIRVPHRFDVRLESGGGGLRIEDVEGKFTGSTGGGEIVLRGLRGRAELTTGGGTIDVRDSTLEGFATTGGGKVDLVNIEGNFSGSSGSGPVTRRSDRGTRSVRGGEREREPIRISEGGGEVNLDEAPNGAVIKTGGGEIRVGRAGGDVEASTGGGAITIGPVAGSVKATTGAGRVHVILELAPKLDQRVQISSGTGEVILELPRELDAVIDVETAYTDSYGKKTRIESDLPLDITETPTWDTSNGTPRRYIRGHRVLGSGRGRIHVRTVNGDIELRTR